MPDREKFNPGGSDFSVGSTETLDLESFLSGNPDEVTKVEETDNQDDKNKVDPKKKDAAKPEVKVEDKKSEIITPFEADDLFSEFKEDGEVDDAEEDNEEHPDKDQLPVLTPKKKDKKENEEVTKEEEESTFSVLTKELLTLGIFTPDEDGEGNEVLPEVKTAEEFRDQFQSEVKKQAGVSVTKFLEQFGPEYAEMFDAVFVNAVPPYEYIARQAKIENIQEFDITTEENQEKIVRQWLKLEGRSQERIESSIQKFKNYGDLEDEAKEAKLVLVAKEQKDLTNLAEQKKQEILTKNKIKQDYSVNVQKILADKIKAKDFDGIPVEGKFAKQTYDYLTKDAYQLKDKTLLTEFDKDILDLDRPENNALKVKVAMLMQILKTDPTLSKIGKRAVSKEAGKVFGDVERLLSKSRTSTQKAETKVASNW